MRNIICTTVLFTSPLLFAQQPDPPNIQFTQPPRSLPPAMSSAIGRIIQPGQQGPSDFPGWLTLNGPSVALVAGPVEKCSIPLLEGKIPAKATFFIQEMPVPKSSADSMPAARGNVCSAP